MRDRENRVQKIENLKSISYSDLLELVNRKICFINKINNYILIATLLNLGVFLLLIMIITGYRMEFVQFSSFKIGLFFLPPLNYFFFIAIIYFLTLLRRKMDDLSDLTHELAILLEQYETLENKLLKDSKFSFVEARLAIKNASRVNTIFIFKGESSFGLTLLTNFLLVLSVIFISYLLS